MKNKSLSIVVVQFKNFNWTECFGSLVSAHDFLLDQYGIQINLNDIYSKRMTIDNEVRWENEEIIIFKRPLHTSKQKKY